MPRHLMVEHLQCWLRPAPPATGPEATPPSGFADGYHTNLGEPTGGGTPLGGQTTVNHVNGGTITGTAIFPPAGSARTGQLGLRWSW